MQARDTCEPRWHSGKQANRASARLSLQLLARIPPGECPTSLLPKLHKAAASLDHHGSRVPALAAAHLANGMQRNGRGNNRSSDHGRKSCGGDPAKDDWLCKSCVGKDGTPYRNHGFRTQCNMCKIAKGSCFGKKAEPRAADIVAKRSLEEKQAAERRHELEIKKLKEELAVARKTSPAAGTAATASSGMELQGAESSAVTPGNSELDAAVVQARERLKKLKELPAELRDLVAGGYETCCTKVQEEFAAAQAARRAANPINKQLESAEAHKKRMEKKVADEKALLQKREAQLAELNKEIESQKAVVHEAEAASARAVAEVASLAAQFASERKPPGGIESLDAQARTPAPLGFVSVAFAEEKWAEREAAFTQQVAQLQALVASQSGCTGVSDAPSEVLDLEAVSDDIFEEDEKWSTVARGKRKALLHRERDILASKVRHSLGKVSAHASPFKK